MDSENIAPGLLESQSIIKEMRKGSFPPSGAEEEGWERAGNGDES